MKTTNDILVSSGFLSWLLVKKKKVQSANQGVFYPHDVVAIQQRDQVSEQWMACLDSYQECIMLPKGAESIRRSALPHLAVNHRMPLTVLCFLLSDGKRVNFASASQLATGTEERRRQWRARRGSGFSCRSWQTPRFANGHLLVTSSHADPISAMQHTHTHTQ